MLLKAKRLKAKGEPSQTPAAHGILSPEFLNIVAIIIFMRKTIVVLILTTLVAYASAQPKNKPVPLFDIVQADGKHLKSTDLAQGQPVMIVYFDPDCDHCVTFINDLRRNADKFKNSEIVLVTYVPLRRLKSYITESGMDNFAKFRIGTEGNKFIVRYHYDVIQFPYVALHDRNGNLFATFESDVPTAAELAVMLKNR